MNERVTCLAEAQTPLRRDGSRPVVRAVRGATMSSVVSRTGLRVTETRVVFLTALCVYLGVGALLVFAFNAVREDSLSRVANAFYAVYSRDPHLAAIGFVWNPLPSLLMIPVLPLKTVWPAVVTLGFAANIVSSLCTAGAVVQLRGILADWGLSRPPRLFFTALFASHPMVLYYGSNGMTEGIFFLFVFLVIRAVNQWIKTGDVSKLVVGGAGLGLAYLTRYEALAAGAGAIALVSTVTYRRTHGTPRTDRLTAAFADAAILAAPLAACVIGWAACSWLIVGNPFEQFASVYGNSSQLRAGSLVTAADFGTPEAMILVLRQLSVMEPLFVVAACIGLVTALRRRSLLILPVVGILGSLLVFASMLFLLGKTAPWLRYYIAVVPLTVLLIAFPFAPFHRRELLRRAFERGIGTFGVRVSTALAIAAVLVTVSAVASTISGMTDKELANEEYWRLGAVLAPDDATDGQKQLLHQYDTERAVARFLDDSRLRKGAVLLDSFGGYPIILASERPKQFVITNDRDFLRALSDPVAFNIEYFLVPDKLQEIDAIARTYPGAFESGAGIGTLVREFGSSEAGYRWRLYRTNAST